ncbi:MAG: hypothetical protein WCK67_05805 [bacterium]
MNGIGSNYNLYNNRIGFGTSTPLSKPAEEAQLLPNLNNIGVEVPVNPQVLGKVPNFGITLKRQNVEVKEDKSKNGKLDWSEVGKNFIKGIGGFAIEAIKHPIRSIAIAAGVGVLTTLCPPLAGIMIGGAAMGGVFSLGGGIIKAGYSLARKDWDGFEKSFEDTGSGLSTILMSAFMARGFNGLKLKANANGTAVSKFEFSKSGVINWVKESFNLVQKEGTESYRSALNIAQANLRGLVRTIKEPKAEGFKFFDFFKQSRSDALNNMHTAKPKIDIQNGVDTPTGFLDKIRFNIAKDKGKFIQEINARQGIDTKNLELSDNIINTAGSALRSSWAYLPDTDRSASVTPQGLDMDM